MGEQIKFIVIKTKEQGMFISDKVEINNYFNSKIPHLLFDGEKLISTFKEHWYKLPNIPQKIEKRVENTYINRRYELKSGFPVSSLTPQVINWEDWNDDSEIRGLYSFKQDTVEGSLEEVLFEIEILSEEDSFYIEKPKYTATPSLITALTTHPSLHTERPCSLSGKEFYRIIRNHVKLNIDPKYARVTSDYDFCFTVEKVISQTPVSYTVDVGTKRKANYQTRYRHNRTVKVFETSPEGYSEYPKQKEINGKNQKDLEEKIEEYLENLMKEINKPFVECSHCSGMGVILEDKN